jgi:hypothetical protein
VNQSQRLEGLLIGQSIPWTGNPDNKVTGWPLADDRLDKV